MSFTINLFSRCFTVTQILTPNMPQQQRKTGGNPEQGQLVLILLALIVLVVEIVCKWRMIHGLYRISRDSSSDANSSNQSTSRSFTLYKWYIHHEIKCCFFFISKCDLSVFIGTRYQHLSLYNFLLSNMSENVKQPILPCAVNQKWTPIFLYRRVRWYLEATDSEIFVRY